MKRKLYGSAILMLASLAAFWPAMTTRGETVLETPLSAWFDFAPGFVPIEDSNRTPVLLDGSRSIGEGVAFSWEVDAGTFVNGTTPAGVHPQVTFPGQAAYKIILHLTDQQGMTATAAGVIPSAIASPTASFIFSPATIPPGDGNETVVRFSSDPSTGEGLRMVWDIPRGTFVNGTNPTSAHPEVTFPGFADYQVTLSITDRDGQVAMVQGTVELTRERPVAGYNFSPAMIPPGDGNQTVVTFDTASALGNGLTFDWEVPGATFVNGTSATSPGPQVTFPGAQNYSVRLKVTDSQGQEAIANGLVPLDPGPPTAQFTFSPRSVPRGDRNRTVVSFDASASTGIRLSFRWAISSARFEDGTGPTSALPQVTFPGIRSYPARLTVTDASGRQASASRSVPVG